MKRDYPATPTHLERLKYEVARDLGLMPKVLDVGWPGLTTAESGRVGGIVARRLRESVPGQPK